MITATHSGVPLDDSWELESEDGDEQYMFLSHLNWIRLVALVTVSAALGGGALQFHLYPLSAWATWVHRVQAVTFADADIRGDRRASVAIVVYIDFECPGCRAFARDVLPYLDEHYISTGKALLATRHLPLTRIHPNAATVAEAFECAAKEGRAFEFQQTLVQETGSTTTARLFVLGERLKLSSGYKTCVERGEMRSIVMRHEEEARALGVSKTPTFMLGVVEANDTVSVATIFEGSRPIVEFMRALDDLLTR